MRRPRTCGRAGVSLTLLLLPAWLAAAAAEPVGISPAPDKVSVTVYRDPGRGNGAAMNLGWLNGFALVSEIRHVDIPAGEAAIRFEGVAGGIIPESAIVTGLPDGVIEKNQDAYLLSPASLLDRSLGRRVHLRRTSRATGKVTEQDAVIRSGADGAVVLQTAEGFEALRCTGVPETIVYDQIPEGLSAKPTLSVRTRSSRAASATITLSYLATGFDWQANYVGTLSPSGDTIDLFAWVTLANGDETSFVQADTQAVAGRLNREDRGGRRTVSSPPLHLQCWPSGTTSDVDLTPQPLVLPPAVAPLMEEIVVTAQKREGMVMNSPIAVTVLQEELGDLKLYRIPEPVTVASNSQKQVALLAKAGVKVESFYRASIYPDGGEQMVRPLRILKTRNRMQEGLGLPLPAGGVVLFAGGEARPILIGEGSIADRAIGEDVEIEVGEAPGVFARIVRHKVDGDTASYALTVTNDQPKPVRFNAEFADTDAKVDFSGGAKLGRRNGRPVWSVTVPANGSATLNYRLVVKS